MTRKIAHQSETTPIKTLDEYLWNERLGVTQLPPTDPTDMSQGQPPTSSLPPQTSQAPTIDYDSSVAPSDMFGSGVSGQDQLIAPKAPDTTPASNPARSKAASTEVIASHLVTHHDVDPDYLSGEAWPNGYTPILTFEEMHNLVHRNKQTYAKNLIEHDHSNKVAAVSTLYGDVDPTPTTGESNGAQSNRSNTPEDTPNGPDASPVKNLAEDAEGAVSDVGEAASIAALASKYRIGSVLDPKESKKEKEEGHYKYIKHRNGKWVIIQKGTGKVLSTHDSREKAIASFKAMMMSKHGSSDSALCSCHSGTPCDAIQREADCIDFARSMNAEMGIVKSINTAAAVAAVKKFVHHDNMLKASFDEANIEGALHHVEKGKEAFHDARDFARNSGDFHKLPS